jgi:hypothetical protein
MMCNCENSKCRVCRGRGCRRDAGVARAMYIGPICNGCASEMPPEYMLPDAKAADAAGEDKK